jgi:hypothetical protein
MTTDIEFDARCPTCGEVRLTGDQLWLVLAPEGVTDHFAFRCPQCCDHVRCPLDEETAALLVELVAVEELVVPAEALEEHPGAPLTVDDLIDFGMRLARERHPAAAIMPSAAA